MGRNVSQFKKKKEWSCPLVDRWDHCSLSYEVKAIIRTCIKGFFKNVFQVFRKLVKKACKFVFHDWKEIWHIFPWDPSHFFICFLFSANAWPLWMGHGWKGKWKSFPMIPHSLLMVPNGKLPFLFWEAYIYRSTFCVRGWTELKDLREAESEEYFTTHADDMNSDTIFFFKMFMGGKSRQKEVGMLHVMKLMPECWSRQNVE